MSAKKEIQKLWQKITAWLSRHGLNIGGDSRLIASCWAGTDAEQRMMNTLSPLMPDDVFRARVAWQKARGVNTTHVFLINERDGEFAGYGIHRPGDLATMKSRMETLRKEFRFVVPWLCADDSPSYRPILLDNPAGIVEIAKSNGFFEQAPLVVLGLEMEEGKPGNRWSAVNSALRAHWSGLVGVHHAGSEWPYIGLGDVILDQLAPKKVTAATVRNRAAKARNLGKKYIGFEFSRHEQRDLAQAALDAGGIGCGNW